MTLREALTLVVVAQLVLIVAKVALLEQACLDPIAQHALQIRLCRSARKRREEVR